MSAIIFDDSNYLDFLTEIKSKVVKTQLQIAKSANRSLIQFYWWLGNEIVIRQEKHGWGKSIVAQLSADLKQSFPNAKGFSAQNLWYMRQFYLEYRDFPNLQQAAGEIPWFHNVLIFSRTKDGPERYFYLKEAAKLGWTRSILELQIESQLFHRQKIEKQHNFKEVFPKHLAEQAEEAMKSVYMLDMLGLHQPVLEADIENQMVAKIKNVLLELGYGFSFIGNQYRICVKNKEYFIDLLFFNRRVQSLIAFEIKSGAFKPEYVGKMGFYLNVLDDFVREPHENPSIGIILCSNQDRFEVEYTLKGTEKPIGVSQYSLTRKLPKDLIDKLPEPALLAAELNRKMALEDNDSHL